MHEYREVSLLKMSLFGIILFHLLITDVTSPETKDDVVQSREQDDLQFKFLKESLRFVKSFDRHYDQICRINHEQTIKSYGAFAIEFIYEKNFGKDENEINPIIDEEIKYIIVYSYSNTTLVNFQIEILVNSYVAHLAHWMKLNFQACALLHEQDRNSDIFHHCKALSDYLEIFVTITAHVRDPQFLQFKIRTIKDVNEDVKKRVINKELAEASMKSGVIYPNEDLCEYKNTEDEKRYCRLWIKMLNAEENRQLRQNHTFFDAYLTLRVTTPYVFNTDDFLSDYQNSKMLWEIAEDLVEYTKMSLVKEIIKDENVVGLKMRSNVTVILEAILKFKKNVLKKRKQEREDSTDTSTDTSTNTEEPEYPTDQQQHPSSSSHSFQHEGQLSEEHIK